MPGVTLLVLLLTLPDDNPVARVLESRCLECHDAKSSKGGLDLSTREALLRGGETGPAITGEDPAKSLLWQVVVRERKPFMPHKKDKLPGSEIQLLADWIRAGTPYSRALKAPVKGEAKAMTVTAADRRHWAFVPLSRPGPPAAGHPIDAFIRAKLAEAGLKPSPPATREALIRRATFDLLGLPPTPAETDAFVNDAAPDAWTKVVDRLLASPHYGERWGRHWLDLARYAETDGFEHDAVRPHSWRYRDYVIRSFNADVPFDRFLREQVAGDELWPGEPDALTATGFNLLGPDMVDSSDPVQRRLNTLNDMTDTAASVFLGLTLGCARCHDHKFEPLPQRDYYRLQAFFSPAAFKRETPVPTAAERLAHDEAMREWNARAEVRELAEIEGPARQKVREKKLATLTPEMQEAVRTPPEKRTTEQENLAIETEPLLEVAEKDVVAAMDAAQKARRRELLDAIRKFPKPPALPLAMTVAAGKPVKTHLLFRGEYTMPREEVSAGFPEVLGGGDAPKSARTALADWLVAHPLTARVWVNRIWQHHFGRGLVAQPSEFGPHGASPTHPELLDWLASELVSPAPSTRAPLEPSLRARWSVKAMHRLILTSETWRQSSAPAKGDPENRLYGRMNRLRLEGEAIRDALLAISGRLNPAMGGPGVSPPLPPDVLKGAKGWTVTGDPREHRRRSVYLFAKRNLRFPFLEVFDAPDSNLTCPERGRSTTAPQSLTLLNAEEVVEAAKATAARVERDAGGADARIALAYRWILGRGPAERELDLARRFLGASPLSELCRALFNLNAFIYVE